MEFIPSKTIVTRTKNPSWFGADYNMNIYRGCNHGCIYCDSRSECYGVEDFGTVRAKKDALEIIGRELAAKRKKGVVATGSMSDPYNAEEKRHRLTRGALELLERNWFGVGIATKSGLVVRDIDLLQEIKLHSPVIVKVTLTTCDDGAARKTEPYAPPPSERIAAVKELSKNNIFTGVLSMPLLPFIGDSRENVEDIVGRAADSGARFVFPGMGVTLRDRQREWFYNKLDESFPETRRKYERRFGESYQCGVENYRGLYEVFRNACVKKGLLYKMEDIIEAYRSEYYKTQLSFF